MSAQLRRYSLLDVYKRQPYAPYSMLEQCQKKEIFYELCEKHGVPYPHTFTFTMAMLNAQGEAPAEVLDQIDFPYPMILKPSDGIMWWQHEFEGQKLSLIHI